MGRTDAGVPGRNRKRSKGLIKVTQGIHTYPFHLQHAHQFLKYFHTLQITNTHLVGLLWSSPLKTPRSELVPIKESQMKTRTNAKMTFQRENLNSQKFHKEAHK